MMDNNAVLSGEQKLRKRRSAFWRYLTLAFVGSMVVGFFSGYTSSAYLRGDLPQWAPILAVALALVGLAWFTWDYFRRVDELDLMDNLWSHLVGFYGALLLFGGWYFLADIGLTTYPDGGIVMAAMLVITLIVYGLRKLGLR